MDRIVCPQGGSPEKMTTGVTVISHPKPQVSLGGWGERDIRGVYYRGFLCLVVCLAWPEVDLIL